MNTDLIKLSAVLFITGVFLEGLALLFQGLALSAPIYLGGKLLTPSLRLLALSSSYILSGLVEVLLAAYLYMKFLRVPGLNYLQFLRGKESAVIIDSALILLFLAGVEGVLRLNLSGGVGLLVSATLFTLILHPNLTRAAGLGGDEVLNQSLILSSSILLAYGGFSTHSVIALVHVGLISIPILIYSLTQLIRLVNLIPLSKELSLLSSLILEVFVALAVLAGGGTNISGVYLVGLNAVATFSAGLYVASGTLGIVTGVLLLIAIITIYASNQLFRRGVPEAHIPMQI